MAETLQQISDHVWLYPYTPDSDPDQPGVGVILTSAATVLIDAGNSPHHARLIRTTLRDIDAPPVTYVIYTHHHWDHTFGAQIWYDSTIVAHETSRALLTERYGSQPWSQHYIQELMLLDPAREPALRAISRAIDDWKSFKLVLPHMTFTDRLDLILPDVTLALKHVGGQHAADSIIIQLEGVMFVGDCWYPPPAHVRQPGDTLDYALMNALLADNAAIYIDAHGRPRSHSELSAFAEK